MRHTNSDIYAYIDLHLCIYINNNWHIYTQRTNTYASHCSFKRSLSRARQVWSLDIIATAVRWALANSATVRTDMKKHYAQLLGQYWQESCNVCIHLLMYLYIQTYMPHMLYEAIMSACFLSLVGLDIAREYSSRDPRQPKLSVLESSGTQDTWGQKRPRSRWYTPPQNILLPNILLTKRRHTRYEAHHHHNNNGLLSNANSKAYMHVCININV